MKRALLVLIFSSVIFIAKSQNNVTVSGYIKDRSSGESLPGAVAATGSGGGTSANAYGYYSLAVPAGKIRVSYSFLGFEPLEVVVDLQRDTTLNILLVPQSLTMGEVIVKGKQPLVTNRDLGNVSVNVSQLKYTPLFLGEQDIFKYLQILPGVSSGKEGSSGLNIRGGSSDQSQILLDEVPIYNQSHAFGFVSIFNGDAVKSADLNKGYTSPAYGGRLSGLASITMRDGNRYEHHQSLQIGTVTASGMLEGPIKKGKGSYIVSARRFVPDLFLRGAYKIIGDDSDVTRVLFNFYDVTAKASYDLGVRNSVYVSFYTGRDALDVGYIDGNDLSGKFKRTSRSNAGFAWGNTIGSLRWNTFVGSNMFINTTLYYSFLGNEKHADYKDYIEGRTVESVTKSRMRDIGLRSTAEHTISPNYKLSYGFNLSTQVFQPRSTTLKAKGVNNGLRHGNRDLWTVSGFLNNALTLGRWDMNAGIRFSHYDNTSLKVQSVEPRVSTAFRLDGKSSLWVSYVRNSQPLFSMGQYYFAMPIDYWIPFTEKKIPTSGQVSLGGRTSVWNGLELTSEVYYKKMRNISLVYDSDDFLLGEGGYDVAKGVAYGFEFSAQYSADRYSFIASYAYSKSRREVDGLKFPFQYDTPHELNVFGMYDVLKLPGRKHTLSVNLNYKTGLPYILSNETYPSNDGNSTWGNEIINYPVYPNTRLVNFFRTDLSYNMEKVKRNGVRNWQISILNATGHKNPYVVYKKKENFKSLVLIPVMPSFSYKRTF